MGTIAIENIEQMSKNERRAFEIILSLYENQLSITDVDAMLIMDLVGDDELLISNLITLAVNTLRRKFLIHKYSNKSY